MNPSPIFKFPGGDSAEKKPLPKCVYIKCRKVYKMLKYFCDEFIFRVVSYTNTYMGSGQFDQESFVYMHKNKIVN